MPHWYDVSHLKFPGCNLLGAIRDIDVPRKIDKQAYLNVFYVSKGGITYGDLTNMPYDEMIDWINIANRRIEEENKAIEKLGK